MLAVKLLQLAVAVLRDPVVVGLQAAEIEVSEVANPAWVIKRLRAIRRWLQQSRMVDETREQGAFVAAAGAGLDTRRPTGHCFVCGRKGHMAVDCPNRAAPVSDDSPEHKA
jgi:hypothetical protein